MFPDAKREVILFRAMLEEARTYSRNPSLFDSDLMKASDAKALLPVINGSTRLLVHVESANDILKVLDLSKDFPSLKLVLVGVNEGWRVANAIAAAKVPVLASALSDLPYSFEDLAATQSNIGRMKRAGVEVAIGMINDRDAHQLRYSMQYAGNLVALNKVPRATELLEAVDRLQQQSAEELARDCERFLDDVQDSRHETSDNALERGENCRSDLCDKVCQFSRDAHEEVTNHLNPLGDHLSWGAHQISTARDHLRGADGL